MRRQLADLPNCAEVAERLTHLTVVNIQKCIVHPIPGKGLPVRRLRLGDFKAMPIRRRTEPFISGHAILRSMESFPRYESGYKP